MDRVDEMDGVDDVDSVVGASDVGDAPADRHGFGAPVRWRAVLFDMDGTVADCFEDIREATNYAMRELGLPEHELASVRRFVGNGVTQLCRLAVGERADLTRAAEEYVRAYYAEHPADRSFLYAGIAELVHALRGRGIRTALVSNKTHGLAVRALEAMGGGGLFDVVQGEIEGVARKPAPDMLLRALSVLGERAGGDVAMVGDGGPDIAAGRAAGVTTVGVTWGMSPREELESLGPDRIVESVAELRAFLLGG